MQGRGDLDAAALPLLRVASGATVAYRAGVPVSAATFVEDVQAVARLLPPGRPVINLLTDRYRFAVGFAAALVQSELTLMPGSYAPGPLAELRRTHPAAVVLYDPAEGIAPELDGPAVCYPDPTGGRDATSATSATSAGLLALSGLRPELSAAVLFTSGSTGTPVAHSKTWGMLARTARQCAPRLSIHPGQFASLVATVPAQHMFGLEASVVLPLQLGIPFAAERPFFPADVAAELARLPRPRLLVTTPVHLRSLVADDSMAGLADYVLTATAMLDPDLARRAEGIVRAPVFEIYGCTELGQLAWRRPALDDRFAPLPTARFEIDAGSALASSLHGEQVALGDVLVPEKAGRFRITGRHSDLVNIGGKRSSLAYLTAQLLSIPGVVDGVFLNVTGATEAGLAAEASGAPARLACAVVAPGQSAQDIRRALAGRIDPAFLPRPLACVEALPREASGKLAWRSSATWSEFLARARDAVH